MAGDLKKLVALQDIDIRIVELENSKLEFPVLVEKLEKAMAEEKVRIAAIDTHIVGLQNEKKSVEDQVEAAKRGLEKSQERLGAIKTNKEYDAVHSEIEAQKAIIASADKKILKITTEKESLQNELQLKKDALDKVIAENQPKIIELKEKISTIDTSIAAVVSERNALSTEISKQMVRTYDHARTGKKKGKVISIIGGENRNCTVCYQTVPPQLINQIRKSENLIFCQNCGAILIWEDKLIDS